MSWDVVLTRQASRELALVARRDPNRARRLVTAVPRYVETGRADIKKLRAADNERRSRVGDWRIVVRLSAGTLTVLDVIQRKDAYRA